MFLLKLIRRQRLIALNVFYLPAMALDLLPEQIVQMLSKIAMSLRANELKGNEQCERGRFLGRLI